MLFALGTLLACWLAARPAATPPLATWYLGTSIAALLPLLFKAPWRLLGLLSFHIYWQLAWFYVLTAGPIMQYFGNDVPDMLVAVVLTAYYVLSRIVDWRIAATQFALSFCAGAAWLAVSHTSDALPSWHTVVIAYGWLASTLLAATASTVRRDRENNALLTMGIIAHEFRNPLAAAGVLNETIARSLKGADPSTAARLGPLTQRMASIFRSMNSQIDLQMTNARLNGAVNATREVLVLPDVVRQAIALYPESYPGQSSAITMEADAAWEVRANREALTHVFLNLLSNSFKAITRAGREPARGDIHVSILGVPHGKKAGVEIQVTDKGSGIPAHRLTSIFTPFFTTDSAGSAPAHGLGLAMCHRTVAKLGGTIRVASTYRVGTTITIWLPVRESVSDPHPSVQWGAG